MPRTTNRSRHNVALITAKLEEAKLYHLRELNRAIFNLDMPRPVRPLTRRERFDRKLARVRGYFRTVWAALCGQPLVLESED